MEFRATLLLLFNEKPIKPKEFKKLIEETLIRDKMDLGETGRQNRLTATSEHRRG